MTLAIAVEYQILDKTYSVVFTSEDNARKCVATLKKRGRSYTARYVSVSEETGKITARHEPIDLYRA